MPKIILMLMFANSLFAGYAGTFKTGFKKESGLGYLANTFIELSESGYLFNTINKKYLGQDEAFKMWDYLFKKQENVMHLSKAQQLTKNEPYGLNI